MDTPVTEPPPPTEDPTPSPQIEINITKLLGLIVTGTWTPEILEVMMKILATHPKLQIILIVILALVVIAIVICYMWKNSKLLHEQKEYQQVYIHDCMRLKFSSYQEWIHVTMSL